MSLMRPEGHSIGHSERDANLAPLPPKTLEKIGFFQKTGNLVLYKKSERICAAIFVVSDAIASASLRERVRDEALAIFSGVRDAILRRGSVTRADADALAFGAASLVSVLEMACRIGEVTESNYMLLRQECLRLADSLVAAAGATDTIDRRIFETGIVQTDTPRTPELDRPAPRRPEIRRESFKGHVKDTTRAEAAPMSFKGNAKDLLASLGSSIEDRESKIIDVVRSKGRVSIKDITDALPTVGEKTVQRALVSLVSRGVLKKEGERRWSRYTLAQATLSV